MGNIEIESDLDPRKCMGQNEGPRAGYQPVSVSMRFDRATTDEELWAWLKSVESCPVSDKIAHATPLSLPVDRV